VAERGFSRPRLADKTDELAGLNAQVDTFESSNRLSAIGREGFLRNRDLRFKIKEADFSALPSAHVARRRRHGAMLKLKPNVSCQRQMVSADAADAISLC
jgi:hypothetical protein